MGRLRDDYEAPLWCCIAEEVIDLFGVDDVYLFRHSAADNLSIKDPLWDEPTTTVAFKRFKIKALFTNYEDQEEDTEQGGHQVWMNTIYLSLGNLVKAGVNQDKYGNYVGEGDAIRLFYRGEEREYFILQADRTGYVNNSDSYTGYELEVKRNEKYFPERATSDGNDI